MSPPFHLVYRFEYLINSRPHSEQTVPWNRRRQAYLGILEETWIVIENIQDILSILILLRILVQRKLAVIVIHAISGDWAQVSRARRFNHGR